MKVHEKKKDGFSQTTIVTTVFFVMVVHVLYSEPNFPRAWALRTTVPRAMTPYSSVQAINLSERILQTLGNKKFQSTKHSEA